MPKLPPLNPALPFEECVFIALLYRLVCEAQKLGDRAGAVRAKKAFDIALRVTAP